MEVKNVLEIYEKKRERVQEFKRIVERVNFYKIQQKGVDMMCEITDRIRREGKIEGRIEDIMQLLEELEKIPTKIAQRITQETDLNVLAGWLKCAAAVSSISEFEARMAGITSEAGSEPY